MTANNRPIALITGSNRGIGLETAKQLARRGFHVIIAARDESSGREAAASIQADGGSSESLALDVSNSESIQKAAQNFASIADHLEVLVNNAGIYPDEGVDILTISRSRMADTFATNTFGALEVTQAFWPFLKKAEGARVINVSSGYGQLDGLSHGAPSYCLSKFALNGVTLMLSQAGESNRIAVNSVCPGWVRTDMGGANATRSVAEGADTIVWLAAEAPSELTGKFFRDRSEIPW